MSTSRISPLFSPRDAVGPLVSVLLIACSVGLSAEESVSVGPDPGELLALAADSAAPPAYQTSLPVLDQSPPPIPWGVFGGLGTVVFWVLVAGGLVLLLVWLGGELVSRWKKDAPPSLEVATARRRDDAEAATGDPRAEAARGRYDAAIHALLRLSVQRLVTRSALSEQPSRTSRELQRELALEGAAGDSFGALVRAVEISHFGGVTVGRDEYEECKEHYRLCTGEALG